jgi:serine phosphatase RsbU (regulator of sigma subunit)
MLLLTDGVTEAESVTGKPFGYDSTLAVVEAKATEAVAAIRDALFAALTKHSPVLADDATILVLRYMGK